MDSIPADSVVAGSLQCSEARDKPDDLLGLWAVAELAPDRIAVWDEGGVSISYGDFVARVNRLSNALCELGLKRGDAITIVALNDPEVLCLFFAALQTGLYYVPVNYHGTADDIAHIVADSGSLMLIFDTAHQDVCRAALAALGEDAPSAMSLLRHDGVNSLQALIDRAEPGRPDNVLAGSLMQYTSGTTGRPKGVRRALPEVPVDTVAAASAEQLRWYGMQTFAGPHLITSPLYHNAVISHAISAINLGHGVIVTRHFDAESVLAIIERCQVASSHMVATQFHRLLALPSHVRARYSVGSMTHLIHGAAPTPAHIKRAMIDWFGPVVYEYYGSSEVGATLVSPQEWLARPGTVGRPIRITTLKILDDDGSEKAQWEKGWVYMRQGTDRFEYYGDPDKTRRARRDGMICVGDIGYVDEEGYLFLCGRDAEIIISGGVNIYPAAIEACLLEHPSVLDCGVIGVPDEEFGEQVKAVVSVQETSPGLASELLNYCRTRLSAINCPRSVDFVDTLPRDPNGKLLKHKIRSQYWENQTDKEGSAR